MVFLIYSGCVFTSLCSKTVRYAVLRQQFVFKVMEIYVGGRPRSGWGILDCLVLFLSVLYQDQIILLFCQCFMNLLASSWYRLNIHVIYIYRYMHMSCGLCWVLETCWNRSARHTVHDYAISQLSKSLFLHYKLSRICDADTVYKPWAYFYWSTNVFVDMVVKSK